MNKIGFIYITAYWNDTKQGFGAKCVVSDQLSDPDYEPPEDDDDIFYYFNTVENIIGNHGDFTVTDFEQEEKMKYNFYEIDIVEMQSESCPYGDPDEGVPEDALNDFLNLSPQPREAHIVCGEHEFTVWAGENPNEYFANAWSIPGAGMKKEFCAYYEFKVGKVLTDLGVDI